MPASKPQSGDNSVSRIPRVTAFGTSHRSGDEVGDIGEIDDPQEEEDEEEVEVEVAEAGGPDIAHEFSSSTLAQSSLSGAFAKSGATTNRSSPAAGNTPEVPHRTSSRRAAQRLRRPSQRQASLSHLQHHHQRSRQGEQHLRPQVCNDSPNKQHQLRRPNAPRQRDLNDGCVSAFDYTDNYARLHTRERELARTPSLETLDPGIRRNTATMKGDGPTAAALGRTRRKQPALTRVRERVAETLAQEWQKVVIEGVLRQRPLPPSKDGRFVPVHARYGGRGSDDPQPELTELTELTDERRGGPYVTNFIRSSRYTLWSFLPRQLFFQFSRLGNFYFLVLGCLQQVPGWSTTGRFTTLAPLLVFVALSMVKEGYDDYRRYVMDKGENRSSAWVLRTARTEGRKLKRGRVGQFVDKRKKRDDLVDLEDPAARQMAEDDGGWTRMQWQDLRVGDVVRLRRDDGVPADMVLLHATGPNGIAYIETMALDGETNLKSKQAPPILSRHCGAADDLRSFKGGVVSEDPNIDLYSYEGRACVGHETLPLSLNNVVLRGSVLRNTATATGLVVNSGEECKIRMNASRNVRAKTPAMQRLVNWLVLFLIVVLLSLAFGLTGGYYLVEPGRRDAWYLTGVPFANMFFGYLIMFDTLIPLSLYISLEIIKIGQLYFMSDVEMYDPKTDTAMTANTGNVLENLGQVNYIFSDKTGTLTENIMRFRKMSVAGTACFHDPPRMAGTDADADADADLDNKSSAHGFVSMAVRTNSSELKTEALMAYVRANPDSDFSRKARHLILCIALCHTCLPEIKRDGSIDYQASSPDELALVEAARDFGYTVVERGVDSIVLQLTRPDGSTVNETYSVLDVIEFSSARKRMSIIIRTPDDRICILSKGADSAILPRLRQKRLAQEKSKTVQRRASTRRTLEQNRLSQRLSISGLDDHRRSFHRQSSDAGAARPPFFRMGSGRLSGEQAQRAQRSVEYDRIEENGAYAAAMSAGREEHPSSLINEGAAALDDGSVFERTFQHIDGFASDGLRTLLYGFAYLDEQNYREWKEEFHEASTSLTDRQKRVEAVAERIESDLELAGATAIEDKLQDGVPETIDKLRRAGIKVWMLTGDKRETAINIGYSAHVCKPASEIFIIDSAAGDVRESLTAAMASLDSGSIPHSVLVIDGHTLSVIESDEKDGDDEAGDEKSPLGPGAQLSATALFYDLITAVDSVICCRASPSQKAALVTHVKRRVPGSMTLAIGDGSNDIGMIQASHVGIGISGREGLQAARIADYSIAQFRFLLRLVLVHGRWNYGRTGKYVVATFWKEMFFYLVQAHYQQFTQYTGTSLYESWTIAVFNVLFTSIPVILMGIVHRDLKAETLLAFPELYASFGPKSGAFNLKIYLGWMFMAIVQSLILFWLMYAWYMDGPWEVDNQTYGMGLVTFTAGVIFINIKILLIEVHNKNIIIVGGFGLSLILWFTWNLLIGRTNFIRQFPTEVDQYWAHETFYQTFGRQKLWWCAWVTCLAALVMVEGFAQMMRRYFLPTDVDVFQKLEKDGRIRDGKIVPGQGGNEVERGEADDIPMMEMGATTEGTRERSRRK